MRILDLTGKKFTRLLVIKRARENINKRPAWVCLCDCGKEIIVRGSDLRMEKHKSCGCLQIDSVTKHGNTQHGGKPTREYQSWVGMKQRCNNPKNPRYKDWGGRGIKVCERWMNSFKNFLSDMGPCPSDIHSLDRIDNDQDYTPENCKWSNPKEQANNKRKTHKSIAS